MWKGSDVAKLEHYISVGQKRLRCGYTTGTCAAAATLGAATLLLSGEFLPAVTVHTPAGIDVVADLEDFSQGEGWVQCAVRKDAGDDPDVTDGILVYARVTMVPGTTVPKCDNSAWHHCHTVRIDGGLGVGRVTRPGLDQPVGAAAINHVPRQMIERAARDACEAAGYEGGLDVVISIPAGVELAARTFNPRLGIQGGISVLGTSGIVRPMSEDALVASLELEMRVQREAGRRDLLVAPGNYGRDFAEDALGLDVEPCVQCSNYLGATIDAAVRLDFRSMLVVGALGKLVKVAAGIMNTHSRVADGRKETLAAHAALAGADRQLVARIMGAVTTDEVLPWLDEAGILEETMGSLAVALEQRLRQRAGEGLDVEAIFFSPAWGVLGQTSGAGRLLALHRVGATATGATAAAGAAATGAAVV